MARHTPTLHVHDYALHPPRKPLLQINIDELPRNHSTCCDGKARILAFSAPLGFLKDQLKLKSKVNVQISG